MAQDISRKSFLQFGAGLAAATVAAGPAVAASKAAPQARSGGKTLIRNVDVLTMQVDHAELLGMDVMLASGRIAAIGKSLPAGDAEVIDGTGRILMPGFTDAFRQTWQTLDTGRMSQMNQGTRGYNGHLQKLTAAMTPEDRHLSDYLGGVDALNSGFTALISLDRFGSPEGSEASRRGLKESGIGGVWSHAMTDPYVSTFPGPAEFRAAEQVRDKDFHSDDDLQFGLTMNLQWGKSYAELRDYFANARRLKPKMMTMYHHSFGSALGDTPKFTPPALPAGTIRTVADLRDCGILGPDLQLNHATELTDEELRFLAKAGVTFGSAVMLEYHYPQGETSIHGRAQKAGAAAGIAMDVPFGLSRDPFEMIRMGFVSLWRTPESRAIAETYGSDDSLVWLTRDGARCARMGDVAGTITVGKRADVILLNTNRLGFPTAGGLADRVASFALLSDIDSVWVGGKARKRDGAMLGVDIAALKAKVAARQQKVWQAMGSPHYGVRG